MIVPEKPEFEKAVFEQESPIAVPVELTVYEGKAGAEGLKLLSYSFAEPVCRAFEARFAADPLSPEAVEFLVSSLRPLMEPFGYDEVDTADYPLLDYRPAPGESASGGPAPDELGTFAPAVLISTLDGERWHEDLPLDEFALDPSNPVDRMAVVRDGQGTIVCFAGLNDISEDEGFCEMNVECAEAFRGRGYGPACTSLLTDCLTGLGERVQYVTSHLNEPSVRCAEKAGLTLAARVFPVVFRKSGEDDAEFFDFT